VGVNSLPKTVTGQRRDCDLNPGPSARESSTLTTRLPNRAGGSMRQIDNESVPIQLAQCRFPGLAISSAKV